MCRTAVGKGPVRAAERWRVGCTDVGGVVAHEAMPAVAMG